MSKGRFNETNKNVKDDWNIFIKLTNNIYFALVSKCEIKCLFLTALRLKKKGEVMREFRKKRFGEGRFGERKFGERKFGYGRESFGRESFGRETPVKEGEEYDVTISEIGTKGDGIARVKNFVIFVSGVRKDDKVKIKIKEVRGRHAVADVVGKAEVTEEEGTEEEETEKEAPAEEEETEKEEGTEEGEAE